MCLSRRVLVKSPDLFVRRVFLHDVANQFFGKVTLDLVLTHVYAALCILALNASDQTLELHLAVASALTGRQVRHGPNLIKTHLVLINDAAHQPADAGRCLAQQHHLVEISRILFFQPNSHARVMAGDHTMSATALNIDFLAVLLLSCDGCLHEHALFTQALLEPVLSGSFKDSADDVSALAVVLGHSDCVVDVLACDSVANSGELVGTDSLLCPFSLGSWVFNLRHCLRVVRLHSRLLVEHRKLGFKCLLLRVDLVGDNPNLREGSLG